MTSETGINGEAPAFIHLPVERSVDAVVGKQDCGHEWRIGIKRQFGAKPQEFVGSGFDAKTYR